MNKPSDRHLVSDPNDPSDRTMRNIAKAYVDESPTNQKKIEQGIALLSGEEQSEFRTEISFFGLLRHEERMRINAYDYERGVLLNVGRTTSKEEQTHPKVEVIAILDYLMDEGVIDGDRHEVLCGMVDSIYS